ncbi:MAG: hypothetical protein ACSHWV_05680 [Cellulophaga fucicola]
MERNYLKEIVCESFKKAKEECASHSKYALAMHIADKTTLSSKTLERAYNKYVSNKESKYKNINDSSVNLLCEYLGYENYKEYVKANPVNKKPKESTAGPLNSTRDDKVNKRSALIIIVLLICALGAAVYFFSQAPGSQTEKCMVWVKTEYQLIDCTTNLPPEYRTQILPYDKNKLKNFKKVEVTMVTNFFDEITSKPLLWYCKDNDEIEYFSSPGLHPVTGKTLRAITPYIIEKYVPLHSNNKSSFINE